jgi:hypothetical protein
MELAPNSATVCAASIASLLVGHWSNSSFKICVIKDQDEHQAESHSNAGKKPGVLHCAQMLF